MSERQPQWVCAGCGETGDDQADFPRHLAGCQGYQEWLRRLKNEAQERREHRDEGSGDDELRLTLRLGGIATRRIPFSPSW